MNLNDVTEKPRVLMVGPGLEVTGGVSAVINNWLHAGLEDKVELKYIASLTESRAGWYPSKITDGLKAVVLFLRQLIKHYDVVHIHLSYGASFYRKLIFFVLAKAFGKKVLIQLHGSRFEEFHRNAHGAIKLLISFMFNRADRVLVLSRQWQHFVQEISSNPEIHILFNGAFPRERLEKKSGNELLITFMGRLGERKGTYDLVEAFAILNRDYQGIRLLLCGDGEIDKVKAIVKSKCLEGAIEVPGWVSGEEKEAIYLRSDMFILPSYNEGLPGAIVEAMSYGLPVISTYVGGIPEAVEDGVNGVLFEAGDIRGMVEGIKRVVDSAETRCTMGEASRELIQKKFNIYSIVEQLMQHYSYLKQA